MTKLYINLRTSHGVETVCEYDPAELTSKDIVKEMGYIEKTGRTVRSMGQNQANRLRARRELAEYNLGYPGHYLSTRCTKEWGAR
jgi:hypothetical protein